jgi:SAM-dependent methyltransferase
VNSSVDQAMGVESRRYYDASAERWRHRDPVLLPAEVMLLHKLKGQWPQIRMLDIGVGGGRTTAVFSAVTKSYEGIDYSSEMCNVVKERFPDIASSIQCVDARDLSCFEDSSFDLVLFAYNGIDHVEYHERPQVFKEMHRVLRDQGMLLFSTHCLRVLVPRICREISLRKRLRYLRQNPDLFLKKRRKDLTHAVVREGPVRVVYVDPFLQWRQLSTLGFEPLQAIDRRGNRVDLDTGDSGDDRKWDLRSWWVHYFCVAKK